MADQTRQEKRIERIRERNADALADRPGATFYVGRSDLKFLLEEIDRLKKALARASEAERFKQRVRVRAAREGISWTEALFRERNAVGTATRPARRAATKAKLEARRV